MTDLVNTKVVGKVLHQMSICQTFDGEEITELLYTRTHGRKGELPPGITMRVAALLTSEGKSEASQINYSPERKDIVSNTSLEKSFDHALADILQSSSGVINDYGANSPNIDREEHTIQSISRIDVRQGRAEKPYCINGTKPISSQTMKSETAIQEQQDSTHIDEQDTPGSVVYIPKSEVERKYYDKLVRAEQLMAYWAAKPLSHFYLMRVFPWKTYD